MLELLALGMLVAVVRPVRQAVNAAVVIYVAALVPLAVDHVVHWGVLS